MSENNSLSPEGRAISLAEVVTTIRGRLTSGNSVPVERAHITREEWQSIELFLFDMAEHVYCPSANGFEGVETYPDCGECAVCVAKKLTSNRL